MQGRWGEGGTVERMFEGGEIIGGLFKWADAVKEGRLKITEGFNRTMV